MENKTVLEVSGAGRTFPDGTVALTDISFAINQGEFAVIAGSNGSGKSVLMSLIAGLDEPTTGLHAADVHKLIEVLQRLVDGGNTVLLIEHNLDVIKTADYVIDLGPEGGDGGGTVVVTGTPEEVAECEKSYTGAFLRGKLGKE